VKVTLLQDFAQPLENLQNLISQAPPRHLSSYWKKRTRVRPFRMVIGVIVAVVLTTILESAVLPKVIKKMSIEMGMIVCCVVVIVVFSWLVYRAFLKYVRRPQSARRLLEVGKLTYGHVIRLSKTGNMDEDAMGCMIEVQFEVDNMQQNAQCRLFVSHGNFDDVHSLANSDEKIAILYDELSPIRITLPQFIAFGS
jgi:hypothetical protein